MQKFTQKKLQALLKPNLRLKRRSGYVLLSLACILLLSFLLPNHQPQLASLMTEKAVAQVVVPGPTGIYGGVPQITVQPPTQTPVRYAQLLHNKIVVDTVPVNGIGNYVLYYKAANIISGTSSVSTANPFVDTFVPSGTYQVKYLDGFGNHIPNPPGGCNGNPGVCIVTYSPTQSYTLGVQVPGQPINPPPTGVIPGPLGIYGIVTSEAGLVPLSNVTVDLLTSNGEPIQSLQTNGNGFYSFYYTGNGIKNFLTPGKYQIQVSSSGFNTFLSSVLNYNPPTQVNGKFISPENPDYYVLDAALQQNVTLIPS